MTYIYTYIVVGASPRNFLEELREDGLLRRRGLRLDSEEQPLYVYIYTPLLVTFFTKAMYTTPPFVPGWCFSRPYTYLYHDSILGYRGNARLSATSVAGATGVGADDVWRARYLIVQLENRIRPLRADCSVINVEGKKVCNYGAPNAQAGRKKKRKHNFSRSLDRRRQRQ